MMLPQQLTERRMQVDRAAIRRYADITQDYNPLHLNPEFAAHTPMGGIIAHGTLSLSVLWQSLTATFGPERMTDVAMDIRFVRPVRENDWIVAGGARAAHSDYDVWVRAEGNDRSEIVIAGTVAFDVRARGLSLAQHATEQDRDRSDAL
jgi:3-hydroxybutyryl-CoA dehydratase